MDEQVLVTVVGGYETEPLVVTEPLDCAGRHCVNSSTVCARLLRGGCCSELRPASACTTSAGPFVRPYEHDRSTSRSWRVDEMLSATGPLRTRPNAVGAGTGR